MALRRTRPAPRWLVILIAAAIGVILAGGISLVLEPEYESTSRSFVASSDASIDGSNLLNAQTFVTERMKSYAQMVTSTSVLEPVIDDLELDITPKDLAKKVEVSVELNSVVLAITVTDKTRRAATQSVGKQQSRRFYAAARLTSAERGIVTRFLDDMAAEISQKTADAAQPAAN